jgi:hypothetical protein
MRTICGISLLTGILVIAGCGKEQTSQPPAVSPAAPPSGYFGTLVKGQQSAVKGIDTASLNQEVQLFNAQEGRNPKDLNELVTQHYIGRLPEVPNGMRLNYDPVAGKVSVVPQ